MRDAGLHRPLRVLVFAPGTCWPPYTGAKLRTYHLVRALAASADVTFLSFRDAGEKVVEPPADLCQRIVTVSRDKGYTASKVIRGAIGPAPLGVLNYSTARMTERLRRLLSEADFDIVQLESSHLASYIPLIRLARSRPRVVCDWHNVESELMARYADHAPGIAHRLYGRRTAYLWRREERRLLNAADAHIAVTDRDREQLLAASESAARIFVVENGVDVAHYSSSTLVAAGPAAPPVRSRIVFVGTMDYHANIDAVVPFARHIWPQLRRRHPDIQFTIIGRNPVPEVRQLASLPGVEVTGTVEEVSPYYRQALAAVVPLRVGGGSRLKILEALAAGVPVVSTPLGAEGLEVTDGQNIRIAHSPGEMFSQLGELISDPRLRWRLAREGHALVRRRYDWSSVSASHLRALSTVMSATSELRKARRLRAVAAEA
ncbi:MAG TPA: glycosyltransferase family 4 protein [Blastocatellia bacterium]|nr:glycosyltransferase family 4 protein [Blastocatellia bacterium]